MRKTKEAKVLGEEGSESEYIYYKETDRNFCGEAQLSFRKRKVGNGVNGWGLKTLKKESGHFRVVSRGKSFSRYCMTIEF